MAGHRDGWILANRSEEHIGTSANWRTMGWCRWFLEGGSRLVGEGLGLWVLEHASRVAIVT
jgi:hypothetical protein